MYDYIYHQWETLASFAWTIRPYYHIILGFTPVQAVFGRDKLFKLTSISDWYIVNARKQRQVDAYHVWKTPGKSDMTMQ